MKTKVLDFIVSHQLLDRGSTVLVGVSGGPDSMALLHFLNSIKVDWNLNLCAVTVDHQLRKGDSEEDVEYVCKVCQEWNIPFVTAAVDVKSYKRNYKVSTQVAARKLRYGVFAEQMKLRKADYLALGHHGDDQIETLLMSLARTTNLSSLQGIPLRRDFCHGKIIRPLLSVTKEEIEQYCQENKIYPRIDATNEDTTYTRNDIRRSIVPKLKERNSRLHTTMQSLSESLQEDESFLISEAIKTVEKTIELDRNQKKATLDLPLFQEVPVPLQRRAYRLTLDYLYDKVPEQLTYMHEDIFLNLLHEYTNNKVVHFPQNLFIERSYQKIYFYFQDKEKRSHDFNQTVDCIPACITLPNGAIVSISYIEKPSTENQSKYTFICNEDQLSFPLHIRTRLPGDRMRYEGLNGSKKIKDILIDEKIPRHEREDMYILTDSRNNILWLIGLRKAELPETNDHRRYILIEYRETNAEITEEEKDAE
ncbi:tRNA lysidine(34) synthetase TilS [Pseudogracilibacillus sp. SE30717A]|uniref:tRNA lysidine(34) synthetase TilS n=1 Tax=Pseudogracilibacillus sp. SE30717A TaxID=3098293 RepID=UPI00300E5857